MDIVSFEFENWYTWTIRLNWFAIIILVGLVFCIVFLIKHLIDHTNKNSIVIDELSLGIGNSSITLHYSNKDKEIAYKLWVELCTRKIGLPFDEENDVVAEVYSSWYDFFKIARELMKEIPVQKLSHDAKLIYITEEVLNKELRPHLTKWQAKYQKWYNVQPKDDDRTPQEIQREYNEYNELVKDLIETNGHMIAYIDILRKIFEGK